MNIKKIQDNLMKYFLANDEIHMPAIHMNSSNVYTYTREIMGVLTAFTIAIDELGKRLVITALPGIRCMKEYYKLLADYFEGIRKTVLNMKIVSEKDSCIVFRNYKEIVRDSISINEIMACEGEIIKLLEKELVNIDLIAHGNLPLKDLYDSVQKEAKEDYSLYDDERKLLKKIDTFLTETLLLEEEASLSEQESVSVDSQSEQEFCNEDFDMATKYDEEIKEEAESYTSFMDAIDEINIEEDTDEA